MASPVAQLDLRGFTLIIPALGLGNVCQLAIDATINSLLQHNPNAIRHVASIASEHVQATSGVRAFDAPLGPRDVATSVELYAIDSAKVALLQQRAPAYEGCHELWALQVYQLAREAGIERVVSIGAIDAALRGDDELSRSRGPQAVYVTTSPDAAGARCGLPSWLGADGSQAASSAAAAAVAENDDENDGGAASKLPGWEPIAPSAVRATRDLLSQALGSGYAPVYYRRFLSAKSVAAGAPSAPAFSAIMAFASEGDNTADALALAELLIRYCKLEGALGVAADAEKDAVIISTLVAPAYWKNLHGPGFDQSLFG